MPSYSATLTLYYIPSLSVTNSTAWQAGTQPDLPVSLLNPPWTSNPTSQQQHIPLLPILTPHTHHPQPTPHHLVEKRERGEVAHVPFPVAYWIVLTEQSTAFAPEDTQADWNILLLYRCMQVHTVCNSVFHNKR